FRYLHVISGVMWIGLLWYFNFVQIPSMPKIPDEQKPAIGKVIAPTALFWFRFAAMATVLTGIILAILNGYAHQAFTLQQPIKLLPCNSLSLQLVLACGLPSSWHLTFGSLFGPIKNGLSAL
ncbi:MAG: hypothetical protein RLZZ202_988, partial [Pseudomonadota bacterium]